MANDTVGESHNTIGTPSSVPTVNVAPPNAAGNVRNDASEAKVEDRDILDFLVDMHEKAIKAIADYKDKAKVNGAESKGESLYSVKNVLETLEAIEDTKERNEFYHANKKLIATALVAKSIK